MKTKLVVLIIAVVVIVGIGIWYWQKKSSTPASSGPTSQVEQKIADISLGSQILQKTQNPTKDKLPETNPFKNLYKNPF